MKLLRFLETVILASIGGGIFYYLHMPLPFILGGLTFVALWQGLTKRKAYFPNLFRNFGFVILGINFGLSFTKATFQTVSSYFFPYLLTTVLLIFISILIGFGISKRIGIDPITSVFACIPGGMPEMTLASKHLGGNDSYVAIFQTIRMVTVIFIVPALVTNIFPVFQPESAPVVTEASDASPLHYLFYFTPISAAFLLKNRMPAGIIIGGLIVTALLNMGPFLIPPVPQTVTYLAQIFVGASMGKTISIADLMKGGKYGGYYLGASVIMILVSLFSGFLLGAFTTLNYQTAILSTAPGGLFEMVLTASSINGDPAIVSSLQLIRILVIVTVVPSALKWYFQRFYDKNVEKNYMRKTKCN